VRGRPRLFDERIPNADLLRYLLDGTALLNFGVVVTFHSYRALESPTKIMISVSGLSLKVLSICTMVCYTSSRSRSDDQSRLELIATIARWRLRLGRMPTRDCRLRVASEMLLRLTATILQRE
jgi:hypothetical protein